MRLRPRRAISFSSVASAWANTVAAVAERRRAETAADAGHNVGASQEAHDDVGGPSDVGQGCLGVTHRADIESRDELASAAHRLRAAQVAADQRGCPAAQEKIVIYHAIRGRLHFSPILISINTVSVSTIWRLSSEERPPPPTARRTSATAERVHRREKGQRCYSVGMDSVGEHQPGWHLVTYYGPGNILTTRAAYRRTTAWVAAPDQDRPVILDSHVKHTTPMRVAGDDEVIVKRTDLPPGHLVSVA